MDDILVFSTSFEEHLLSIKRILNRLRSENLKIQIEKCSFASETTSFLGHVVSSRGIEPDKKKVDAISKMKLPTTIKEIKQFLGMTAYYRKWSNI